MTSKKTSRRAAALALVLATLGGCSMSGDGSRYDQVYPIAVSQEPRVLEVPTAERLDDDQAHRIAAFARLYRSIGSGPITVAAPQGRATEGYVSEIVAHVNLLGVPPRRVRTGAYDPSSQGDRGVVLSFIADDALVRRCPEQWGESAPVPSNATHQRFGCTHQNNLAAMVERPADLEEPRALTPPDAAARRRVLQTYRAGESTASEGSTEQTSTTN